MKATLVLVICLLLALAPHCFAPPPLVTGDVPTADKQSFEWYVGGRYQESLRAASRLVCCPSRNLCMA